MKPAILAIFYLAILGGVIAGIVAYKRYKKAIDALKAQNPDEPWMWKKGWAAGRIKCMSNAGVWVIGVFALVWNLISWGIVIAARDQVFDPSNRQALLAFAFPVFGLFPIILWMVSLVRHKKYGDSFFQMASVPGVIGGGLAGVVHISKHIVPHKGFKVALQCHKREQRRSSSSSNTTFDHIIHQEEITITRELLESDYSKTAVPVLFAIPYDAQPTSETVTKTHRTSVYWVLTVKAELPGADYNSRFVVPVFRTAESDPSYELDDSALTGYVADADPYESLAEQNIQHKVYRDKEVFLFPMCRYIGNAFGVMFGAVFLTSIVMFLLTDGMPLFMGIIVTLIGVGLWRWTMDLFFWSCRVEMRREGLQLHYGLFRLNRINLSYNAIKGISIKRGMQSGETLYHSVLFAVEAGGKARNISVGKRIRNRKVAQALVDLYKNSVSLAGSNLSSGTEFMRRGQRDLLWKERLLAWTFCVAIAMFTLSPSINPRSIMLRAKFFGIASQLAAGNPEMARKPELDKSGMLILARDKTITNINALTDLPLHALDISETKVKDISPLKGMRLRTLKMWAIPVDDISVVKGMPLERLTIGHCPVSDISMLKGMKLQYLSLTRTKVTDLSVLQGMPLTFLDLNDSRVNDITPIKGAPLRVLMMNGLGISDIAALEGMPLEKLWLERTQVSDISVLGDMPLKELWLQNTNVSDVSILATCSKLELLILNPGCSGIEQLRKLPNLKRIGYQYGEVKPSEAFWKEFDEQVSREGGNK